MPEQRNKYVVLWSVWDSDARDFTWRAGAYQWRSDALEEAGKILAADTANRIIVARVSDNGEIKLWCNWSKESVVDMVAVAKDAPELHLLTNELQLAAFPPPATHEPAPQRQLPDTKAQ